MRKIRRDISNELRDFKGIALYSSRFLFAHESMNMLVSYIAKKTKNVILLSNIHFNDEIPKLNNPKLKPKIILDYNANKSGVDKNNQMVKRKEYSSFD